MSINIITHKSQGLINDSIILKKKLKEKYKIDELFCDEHEIYNIKQNKSYDKQFFIEHIYPNLLDNSICNIFIPNLEFINKNDFNLMKTNQIKYIIAKTNVAYDSLFKHFGHKVIKWIWTSIDRNISRINPDFSQYLHLKGKSRYKNTQMIFDLWMRHPEWPMIHIVHYGEKNINGFLEIKQPVLVKDNITMYQYELDECTLESLMNRCGNHICASETEGYGHYVNEARSVGAVIITTNAAPMNEFTSKKYGFLVNPIKCKKIGLGFFYKINDVELETTIQNCINTSWEHKSIQGEIGKKMYNENNSLFSENTILS